MAQLVSNFQAKLVAEDLSRHLERDNNLFGGCVAQVGALKELGPDYQSTFMATESDPAFEQAGSAANLLIHGKEAVSSMLAMSYNAQVRVWHG